MSDNSSVPQNKPPFEETEDFARLAQTHITRLSHIITPEIKALMNAPYPVAWNNVLDGIRAEIARLEEMYHQSLVHFRELHDRGKL